MFNLKTIYFKILDIIILILDEATSSLDHASEKHIKKAIKEFIKYCP